MPNGFGYVKQPQAPSPDPRKVGRALVQRRMESQPQPGFIQDQRFLQRPDGSAVARPDPLAPKPDDRPPFDPDQWTDPNAPKPGVALALSLMAGRQAGGPGQTGTGSAPPGQPDYPDDGDEHSSTNHAAADAMTRIANGLMRRPGPPNLRRQQDVRRLGLSDFETQILSRTGGL